MSWITLLHHVQLQRVIIQNSNTHADVLRVQGWVGAGVLSLGRLLQPA